MTLHLEGLDEKNKLFLQAVFSCSRYSRYYCNCNVVDISSSNIGNSNLVLLWETCVVPERGDCCFLPTFISSNLIKTKAGKWFIKIWQKNQVRRWGEGGIYLHHPLPSSHQLGGWGYIPSSPSTILSPACGVGVYSFITLYHPLTSLWGGGIFLHHPLPSSH